MSKEQLLLHQYKNDIMNLVQSAKKLIPRNKQDQIFSECFYSLKNNEQKCIPGQLQSTKISNFLKNIFKLFIFIFILAIFIYILLNFHQPTSSLVLRNVQGFIYPGLKILRHLSVPVIQRFPFLTGKLYFEYNTSFQFNPNKVQFLYIHHLSINLNITTKLFF